MRERFLAHPPRSETARGRMSNFANLATPAYQLAGSLLSPRSTKVCRQSG